MLQDKTQALNRLQNSNVSYKIGSFGQNIRNPYLAQYKIFEERLKNPKIKCRSMVMRQKRAQINTNKQNFQKQIKKFQQQECLKEAKKLLKNKTQFFSIMPFRTIGDDLDQKDKQDEVVIKFKTKINDLKMLKILSNNLQQRHRNPFNLKLTSKINISQTASAVQSDRKDNYSTKPTIHSEICQRNNQKFDRKYYKIKDTLDNSTKNVRLPLTFINYKKSKSIAQRFNKQNK